MQKEHSQCICNIAKSPVKRQSSHTSCLVTCLSPLTPLRCPPRCLSPAGMRTLIKIWEVLFHLCIYSTECHTWYITGIPQVHAEWMCCACVPQRRQAQFAGTRVSGNNKTEDEIRNGAWSQIMKNSYLTIKEFRLYRECGLFSWTSGIGQPDKNLLW